MIRFLFAGLTILALLLLAAAGGLALVHRDIRSVGGPLPDTEAIAALASDGDAPARLRAVNTASQAMPRSVLLDPARDPSPDKPYVLGHPAFLLEWIDGRRLLVDAGMDEDAALAFGRPAELVGAAPTRAHGGLAVQLGSELASGPLALVFTHLHSDHTQGIAGLCEARGGAEITVFQRRAQAEHHNYTTRPGATHLREAPCARVVVLEESPLAAIPGYGGVAVAHAAGHTPGSQVVFAAVAGTGYAFLGDVANNVDGVLHDIPRPAAYRLLVVPESDARLGVWRRFLASLHHGQGTALLPSHDQLHLEALGLLQSTK